MGKSRFTSIFLNFYLSFSLILLHFFFLLSLSFPCFPTFHLVNSCFPPSAFVWSSSYSASCLSSSSSSSSMDQRLHLLLSSCFLTSSFKRITHSKVPPRLAPSSFRSSSPPSFLPHLCPFFTSTPAAVNSMDFTNVIDAKDTSGTSTYPTTVATNDESRVEDNFESDEKGNITKKRARQLRTKPGWYRKRSSHLSKAQKKTISELSPHYSYRYSYNESITMEIVFGKKTYQDNHTNVNVEENEGQDERQENLIKDKSKRRTLIENKEGTISKKCKYVLEIGFGTGHALIDLALAAKAAELEEEKEERRRKKIIETKFLGIEWFKAGFSTCLSSIKEHQLKNIRLIHGDAFEALKLMEEKQLDEVLIFFPDPWPNDMDQERRILRNGTLDEIFRVLKEGGRLHVATDVENYAEWTAQLLSSRKEQFSPASSSSSSCFSSSTYSSFSSAPSSLSSRSSSRSSSPPSSRSSSPLSSSFPPLSPFSLISFTSSSNLSSNSSSNLSSVYDRNLLHGELRERPHWRPLTKYERKALTKNPEHKIYDLAYNVIK